MTKRIETIRILVSANVFGLALLFGLADISAAQQVAEQVKTETAAKSAAVDASKTIDAAKANDSAKSNDKPSVSSPTAASIYEKTKVASSIQDYDSVVADCHAVLKGIKIEKERTYIRSLLAWTLNRRGDSKIKLAADEQPGSAKAKTLAAEAMADFDAAIENNPKRAKAWQSRAFVNADAENYSHAVRDFSAFLELKPKNLAGRLRRAEIYRFAGQIAEARADFDVVLLNAPHNAKALTGRGHTRFATKDYEGALADYSRVCDLMPSFENAFVNRGDANQKLERWQFAYDDYEKSAGLSDTGVGYQRAAWMMATTPAILRPEAALLIAEKAIELGGETITNLDTLAAAQAANGYFIKATQSQRKAIERSESETGVAVAPLQYRLSLYESSKPFRTK